MLTNRQKRILNRAVQTGAEVLDQKYPTWFKKIDLDKLDLGDCDACVAGQLGEKYLDESEHHSPFGGFVRKLMGRLGRKRTHLLAGRTDAYGDIYWGDVCDALGFDIPRKAQEPTLDTYEGYAYLDRAWLRQIRRRLRAAA